MAIRDTKDGKGYYVEVFLGTDPNTGEKIRKTKTFRPKNRENSKLAKAWEVDILNQYEKGELVKKKVLLKDYLDEWYNACITPSKLAYNTKRRYTSLLDCVKNGLGNVRADKLRTKMIDDFYLKLQSEMITLKNGTVKRRYMDGTILKVHKIFKQAMDQAVIWEVVVKNYVADAKPPADDVRDIKSWSIEDINDFLANIKESKVYLPTFIAYHTGLREGEVSALKFKTDIDFKKEVINVNHNMVEKRGEGLVLEYPKTDSSKDTVVMTKALKDKLKAVEKEHKIHKLKTGIELEYVCSWEDGRPLRPTYISRAFSKFAKIYAAEHDIAPITFHGLRHSHATILFENGASSQEISKRLRHSRVSTTDDIYIHVKNEIKKSTADIFDKAVDKAK